MSWKEDVLALASGLLLAVAPLPANSQSVTSNNAAPRPITLEQALALAQTSDPAYVSAATDSTVARAQVGIARSAVLPGVVYHNQYLYTQAQHAGGKPVAAGTSSPIFLANNGVHEYISQGTVTETLSAGLYADLRKANAEAAASRAKLEVARRGLVSTVVADFYGALAAEEKLDASRQALDEANHFDTISRQLEAGGEAAHQDVIKSGLQVAQRQRDLDDAQLAAEKAKLDLAVLLFPDPLTPYTVSDDLRQAPAMPDRAAIQAAANLDNPDLRAALASFRAASLELTSSRLDYLPALSLNYTYGIDSPQFAITAPDGSRNLGYSAYATLDLPVWDWFATRNRIRQSAARRDLARTELTYTQRRLLASIEELYREAQVASEQVRSLDTSLRDATEALRLTDLRYTGGEAPFLEVIDAQNTLLSVQTARADGAARYRTALAGLQTLTGELPK